MNIHAYIFNLTSYHIGGQNRSKDRHERNDSNYNSRDEGDRDRDGGVRGRNRDDRDWDRGREGIYEYIYRLYKYISIYP
jgi:hypothetical protein